MSYNRSRRLFIGGTVAASAIGASGISHLVSAQSVSASASPSSVMYGPKPGVAKLNANENPFGPSPKALDAIAKASAEGGAYYAYPAAMTLLDMIAERYGITRKHISDAVQALFFPTLPLRPARTENLARTFFGTPRLKHLKHAPEIVRVANTVELDIDLDAMYAAIDDLLVWCTFVTRQSNGKVQIRISFANSHKSI